MKLISTFSKIIVPFIEQFPCDSVLFAGDVSNDLYKGLNNTRSYSLSTPFHLEQFDNLPQVDLAIICDLIETTAKKQAIEWLGLLKNRHSPHIVLVVDLNQAESKGWTLTDFLGLGFSLRLNEDYALFTYALENYQFKKDWLNSRYWANPENYDKYRW